MRTKAEYGDDPLVARDLWMRTARMRCAQRRKYRAEGTLKFSMEELDAVLPALDCYSTRQRALWREARGILPRDP